ncbi:MAG: c-type cytochrome [Deltaproteobacteria bacterium]|nr:c-type cytochrome [Deltaproteobacteria bacterium]
MKVAVKVLWISLAWLLGWTLFYLLNLQTAYSADLPGKKVFLDYKCNACHTVKSVGIVKVEIKDEEAEEEEGGEKVEPPDLSNLCSKKDSKIECTADFLDKFIRKQVADDKGGKHKKRFKGTPEERKTLVEWLLTLK